MAIINDSDSQTQFLLTNQNTFGSITSIICGYINATIPGDTHSSMVTDCNVAQDNMSFNNNLLNCDSIIVIMAVYILSRLLCYSEMAFNKILSSLSCSHFSLRLLLKVFTIILKQNTHTV